MSKRRNLALAAFALVLLALAGCAHNTNTWMMTEPSVVPGGLIEQPIWTDHR